MMKFIRFCCLASLSTAGLAQDLLITNARIIDGNDGVIESGVILIQDGRVAEISVGTSSSLGASVIDARGMTVMPGFIDGHRHIIRGDPEQWLSEQAADRMHEFIEAGFTTVLSAGDPLEAILELRRRIDEGEIEGPRLLVSGRVPLARSVRAGRPAGVDPIRAQPSWPPPRLRQAAPAIPESETRAAVGRLAELGVDAIKTNILMSLDGPEKETLAIVADEARRQGVLSITHAVAVPEMIAAVEAGTHVLVHTPIIDQVSREEAKTVATSGIPMMSTLAIFAPTFAEDNTLIRTLKGEDNLARFRDLDPYPLDVLPSAGQGPVNARLLWEYGVTYGYGTDTSYLPRESLEHELKSLRLVFSRPDIVRIMSRNAAAAIHRGDDLGTLEPGKWADIVMLDGNPLSDIDDLLNVEVVIKGGRVVIDNR